MSALEQRRSLIAIGLFLIVILPAYVHSSVESLNALRIAIEQIDSDVDLVGFDDSPMADQLMRCGCWYRPGKMARRGCA